MDSMRRSLLMELLGVERHIRSGMLLRSEADQRNKS